MRWIRAAGLALVASLPLACGDDVVVESTHESEKSAGADAGTLPLLELSKEAPWTTRYAGVRRVEALVQDGDGTATLAYREQVLADGEGRFAIELGDVLSFVPDPGMFKLLQATRAGFHYRYRDFAVRDVDALLASWTVLDLDQVEIVAGRASQLLRFVPSSGVGSRFDVALDLETGLVLRAVELGQQGLELSRMEFESYDADPDLEGVAWFVPELKETPLDATQALDAQAGFDVLQPAVLPDGYQPWKAALVVAPDRGRWIKQVFTDGVRPLFFLHEGVAPPTGASGGPGLSGDPGTYLGASVSSGTPDRIQVYRLGPVDVAQGVLRGREVVALGRVGDQALLDLLESAID